LVDVGFGAEEEGFEVVTDEAAVGALDGVPEDDAVAVLVVIPAGAMVAELGVEDVDLDVFVGLEEFVGWWWGGLHR
jgi:hypothetical protein